MSAKNLAAVVLAAGQGKRMKSKTAKVLHEVCGRPLAFYPVQRALEAGASPIVVVVGHQAQAVEARLRGLFPRAELRFAVQKEQLGTAHAVRQAAAALKGHDGAVLVLSGDTPLLGDGTVERLVDARNRAVAALSFLTVTLDDPTGYGRVLRDHSGRPQRIVEEKDATDAERRVKEANAGLYCVDAAFLWKALGRVGAKNAQKEFYLTDLVALAADGEGCVSVPAAALEAAGVNDKWELAFAAKELTRRKARALCKAGVVVEDPERVDLDEGVEVGADTVVEPNARLKGATRVGAGCRIGAGAVLVDALLADGVTVKPYTVVEQAQVARGAVLGPFARLRPETSIAEDAHVGNFVELKKTALGRGSKANHLSYLGDAVIGAGVNVGAGTITCNYDGEKKWPTEIADGVFIGSDSTLVAPVKLGKNAYVGASSCITDDVPAGALALGRARQVVKPGWVAARQKPAAKAAGRAPSSRRRRSRARRS